MPDKYGFSLATGNADEIFSSDQINTVFITTRHHLHYVQVMEGIQHGKNVFVEKPFCMTVAELAEIKNAYLGKNVHLMVGFNRRFSPLIVELRFSAKGNSVSY